MGDANMSGYVDDDDLSYLLANWHTVTDWEHGNLSDGYTGPNQPGYVDDDDLSLLLANWHAGTPPMGAQTAEAMDILGEESQRLIPTSRFSHGTIIPGVRRTTGKAGTARKLKGGILDEDLLNALTPVAIGMSLAAQS